MLRICRVIRRKYLHLLYRISPEVYKEKYPIFLRDLGVKIPLNYREGGYGFIHPSVQFDGNDFSLISVGKNTTISANVVILSHDYSITKALKSIGEDIEARFLKPVSIGENTFVGMNTIILPGKTIGNNVIIGAGSVITKDVPDNVVIGGNPAKVICSTHEWAKKHVDRQDFVVLKNNRELINKNDNNKE